METVDRTITCATCGREFLFTAKEQDFFLNKGFKEPRHCRECRQQRKQERDQAVAQTTGQSFSPGKEKFKVVCAQCQREAFVPFKPSTGKPVLCKDCFIAQKYGSGAQISAEQATRNVVAFQPERLNAEPGNVIPARASRVEIKNDSEALTAELLEQAENTLVTHP